MIKVTYNFHSRSIQIVGEKDANGHEFFKLGLSTFQYSEPAGDKLFRLLSVYIFTFCTDQIKFEGIKFELPVRLNGAEVKYLFHDDKVFNRYSVCAVVGDQPRDFAVGWALRDAVRKALK